jgi:hypothetical protein
MKNWVGCKVKTALAYAASGVGLCTIGALFFLAADVDTPWFNLIGAVGVISGSLVLIKYIASN